MPFQNNNFHLLGTRRADGLSDPQVDQAGAISGDLIATRTGRASLLWKRPIVGSLVIRLILEIVRSCHGHWGLHPDRKQRLDHFGELAAI
jgi:hypothetical protein